MEFVENSTDDETRKPGPKPDRLSIPMDWREALRRAIGVRRPKSGWPKPEKKPKKRPDRS